MAPWYGSIQLACRIDPQAQLTVLLVPVNQR
jgi:hypothetical protein